MHTLVLRIPNIAPGIYDTPQRPKKSPQSDCMPSPGTKARKWNNRPGEPYKSHFSPRKLKKDCPLAPGNWTIMQCKKPSRPKEAQEQKPCISAFLMKLYLILCLRKPQIPEKKLLMPLVELSLPERSGQEHTTHGTCSIQTIFVSNAWSGDISLSYSRRMMAPWNPYTAIARY